MPWVEGLGRVKLQHAQGSRVSGGKALRDSLPGAELGFGCNPEPKTPKP